MRSTSVPRSSGHARRSPPRRSPTACRCTASPSRARARSPSSSPSTPAPAPSAPRRTAWPTSSSTWCSRAARSTTTTARSTRPPSAWAASLNAYTSHDLVAFHITVRAEAATGGHRPAHRLRRAPAARRGASSTRSAASSSRRSPATTTSPRRSPRTLIDRAAFGDHPLGRTVLGPEEHLRTLLARCDRRLPRAPLGRLARRRVHRRQPRPRARRRRRRRAVRALPDAARARAVTSPRPSFAPEVARRAARLQPVAPADDLPPRRSTSTDPQQRAALTIYSTLLGGSMGSRLFDEIREQRGLCYSVYAVDHAFADVAGPAARLRAGVRQVRGGLHADARDRRRAARRRPDRGGGRARPRLRRRPAGARVREHQRRRPPRCLPVDRLRREHRPRRRDRRRSTR